jgi:hypothetical protein
MQKYEYMVTEIKQYFTSRRISEKIEFHLNLMARDGWELHETISSIGMLEIPSYARFIWKREKK